MEDFKLTYSNLIDEETQNYVKDVLIKNGIPQKIAHNFITIVQNYNSDVDIVSLPTSKPGFTTINSAEVPYIQIYLEYRWQKNKIAYDDLNCRITAFGLFGSYINSPNKSEVLLGTPAGTDIQQLEKSPYGKLYDINIEHYGNYFTSFEPGTNLQYNTVLEYLIKGFNERMISYKPNNNISIIDVFLYDSNLGDAFIGHAGILIDLKNEFLFVEKIAPVMPYQVTKLKDKNELKYIFKKRYKYASMLVIMENDQPL